MEKKKRKYWCLHCENIIEVESKWYSYCPHCGANGLDFWSCDQSAPLGYYNQYDDRNYIADEFWVQELDG